MGEPHWFMAYSCTLQQVGEVAHGRKWDSRREALEIKAFPLVHAFWHETDMDLMMASVKLCWEPAPMALYHQKDNGPTTHIIFYLDELAVCVPTLEEWDQMVWPTMAAIPCALTEAKSYGYHMVMEEGGTYLCTMRALVFKGSILAYNPALNEAEWVPAHGLANDLSWAEERSAMALGNYVPCASAEVAQITRLRAGRVVSCPSDDSSTSVEEEVWHSDAPSTDTDHEGEVGDEGEEEADEAETNTHTN